MSKCFTLPSLGVALSFVVAPVAMAEEGFELDLASPVYLQAEEDPFADRPIDEAVDADPEKYYIHGGPIYSFPFEIEILGVEAEFDGGPGLFLGAGVIVGEEEGSANLRVGVDYLLRFAEGEGLVEGLDLALNSFAGVATVSFGEQGASVRPYVGAGAGLSWMRSEISGVADNDFALELQGLFGVNVRLREQLSLRIDGRYTYAFHEDTATHPITGSEIDVDLDFGAFALGLGLEYRF